MGVFLQSLRDGGPSHAVEKTDEGFAVVPRRPPPSPPSGPR